MTDIPAAAKKPADKKPAARKKAAPKTVKTADGDSPEALVATTHGRDWLIPIEAVDDFELLDAFARLQDSDDISLVPFIMRRMLGGQWREAMDLLRDKETGRVGLEQGMAFTRALMEALNPNS